MADNGLSSSMILISSLLVLQVNSNITTGKKRVHKTQNSVIGVSSECSLTGMNVTLELERPFAGAVHARGFPTQCRTLGAGHPVVTLRLSAAGCGLRITPHPGGGLQYSVILEVQTARHLQQATDPVLAVTCLLPDDDDDAFDVGAGKGRATKRPYKRGGRMVVDDEPKAWLGIQGSASSVTVGEPTTLTVNARLPAYTGCRVVDCWAHDGLGETSQALLDAAGCPAAEAEAEGEAGPPLVPAPHTVREEMHAGRRRTVLAATFPAFKFPDRDSVHIRCGLQVCRGSCPQADCSSETTSRQRNQRTLKGEDGEVIDYVQLFNSVEVLAPAIDADDARRRLRLSLLSDSDPATSAASASDHPGSDGVCLPAARVALALAALAAPALLAALAGLCVVLARTRSKRPLARARLAPGSLIAHNSRSSLSAWSYGRI